MASIYKRGKIWHIQWQEGGRQHRRSLRTDSKQRAQWEKAELEKKLLDGIPSSHRKDISVAEFTPRMLEHIALERQPHTIKSLSHEWRKFIEWHKPVNLSDISKHDIERYKTNLLEAGKAKSTVRSSLLALSSVFKVAMKELHVFDGPNPVTGVRLPKPDDKEPKFLTKEQIAAVLAEAEKHSQDMHLVFALGIYAGLRKAEILAARWHWFEFDTEPGVVRVKNGQGFRTKTGKNRHLPMHSKLRPILERYKPEDSEAFVVCPDKTQQPTGTNNRVDFTWAFRTIAKNAGCHELQDGAKCTPHALRHTFATQLAMGGEPLYNVMGYLGHTKFETTQIYARYCPVDRQIDF